MSASSRRIVSAIPSPGRIDVEHLHADDVAGLNQRPRVLDEGLRHCGDVHQPILMHADVDERAERGNVGHHSFEQHAGFEVFQLLHPFAEACRPEGRPRVTTGLFQLAQDVRYRRPPKLASVNVSGASVRSSSALPISVFRSVMVAVRMRCTTG